MKVKSINEINWDKVKAVIFDVDGTLYDHRGLVFSMIRELAVFYIWKPWRIKDLFIIWRFRRNREHNVFTKGDSIAVAQYLLTARQTRSEVSYVKEVISHWIYDFPLTIIKAHRAKYLNSFLSQLRAENIKIAIFSDYEVKNKLQALNVEHSIAVGSTDKNINHLKPHPEGLKVICKELDITPENALMIGDRETKDGKAAEAMQMPYFIIPPSSIHSVYYDLKLSLMRFNQNEENT